MMTYVSFPLSFFLEVQKERRASLEQNVYFSVYILSKIQNLICGKLSVCIERLLGPKGAIPFNATFILWM